MVKDGGGSRSQDAERTERKRRWFAGSVGRIMAAGSVGTDVMGGRWGSCEHTGKAQRSPQQRSSDAPARCGSCKQAH